MLPLTSVVFVLSLTLPLTICDAEFKESSFLEDKEDEVVFRKYIEMDKQLKEMVNYALKRTLPMLMEASESMNLSAKCAGNIFQLTTGIRKLKLSAISFLDASGKPFSGFLDGNLHMLGDYDQCLNATMEKRKGEIAFRGQYCLIQYRPFLPRKKRPITFDSGAEELIEATRNTSEIVRFFASKAHFFYYTPSKYGLCAPSGCSEEDIKEILMYVGERIFMNATLVYCDSNSDVFLTKANIVYISIFVLIGALILIGTFLEYYSWRDIRILKSFLLKILSCFSILSNFPKAISTKKSEDSISCLHGIRALTLFYLILLHQYYAVVNYYITSHVSRAMEEIPQFFFQIIANGFLTADVYLFMGGLVNSYTRIKAEGNHIRKTNFFSLILHRFTRIGPAYLLFSFLMSLFRPYGPMRLFEKREYAEKCRKNWWQNALYINNFFPQNDTCSPHTWYLAVDMQLFLLSLFTVPLFFNRAKKGVFVNSAVIVCGIISTVIWSWLNKLTPGVVFYRPNEDEINSAWNAHTFTLPHIAPYFTGILMGYYLASRKNIQIPKMYQVIGWPVATVLFISMMFMTKVWNSGGAFTLVDSAFYYGFSKFLFVLAICWMILCCATGNGGIINYILSLPLWIPISRISFVVFLISPFLQTFYFANSRIVIDGHRMALIWRYAGDVLISCLFGLVIFVLIESPFKEIEKVLFYRKPLIKETIAPEDIIKIATVEGIKANKNQVEPNHNVIFNNQNIVPNI